jgi:hypothetical protein
MKKTSSSKPDAQQSIDEFENLMKKLLDGELDPELAKENMSAASQLQDLLGPKGKKKAGKSRQRKTSTNVKKAPSRKSQVRKPSRSKKLDSDSEDSVDLESDIAEDVQISDSD